MTEDEKRTINESQVKIQTIFFFAISIVAWLSKFKKKSQTENHDNKPSDLLMSEIIDVVNLNMSQNYKQ